MAHHLRNSNLLFGMEAEFLNVKHDGSINNLVGKALLQYDMVGADGHNETCEIRTNPRKSVTEVFGDVHNAIYKYIDALHRSGEYAKCAIPIRGGSFYGTPLGIHLHVSNFEPASEFYPTLEALHQIIVRGYLEKIESISERNRRLPRYGFPMDSRIKGPGWWEWREPFSCLTPHHLRILLTLFDIIVNISVTSPEVLNRVVTSSVKPSQIAFALLKTVPATEFPLANTTGDLLEHVLSIPRPLWNDDLSKYW